MCYPAPIGAGIIARSVPRVLRESAFNADFGRRGEVVEPIAQPSEALGASVYAEESFRDILHGGRFAHAYLPEREFFPFFTCKAGTIVSSDFILSLPCYA